MKNLRKMIALLLAPLLVLSLSTCGSSASFDTGNTTTAAEQSETADASDNSENTNSNVPGDFPGEPPEGGPGGTPPDGNDGPGENGGPGGAPGGSSADIGGGMAPRLQGCHPAPDRALRRGRMVPHVHAQLF